jgi:hypothetical protein
MFNMDSNNLELMTQDALVGKLHEHGCAGVTKKRIASWREKELLPPFDVIGGGRGFGRGREKRGWTRSDEVLNQALWVYELLKIYKSFDDLYFPLWVLGAPVSIERVRFALSQPLDAMTRSIESEAGSPKELEDLIGDAAFDFSKDLERANIALLQVPQASLETFSNLFMNIGYGAGEIPLEEDYPFLDGVEALQNYERLFQEKCAEIFGDAVAADVQPGGPEDGMNLVFTHATFINKFFSLQRLKPAVDECSNEDLAAVQRDFGVIREMVFLFGCVFTAMFAYLPDKMKPTTEEVLAMLFRLAKWFAWADLSLRRGGHGERIEYCLAETFRALQADFSENVEQQLATAGPELAAAVDTCIEKLMSKAA